MDDSRVMKTSGGGVLRRYESILFYFFGGDLHKHQHTSNCEVVLYYPAKQMINQIKAKEEGLFSK